jgi:CheY-like chemotaxis protein/anti-sigma regulatory factor (Ser/Thr protein kinase)
MHSISSTRPRKVNLTLESQTMANSVLLVEDNALYRRILRDALAAEGYDVSEAGDGESALRILEKERIDLLLTDIVLPGMDGIELMEQSRTLNPRSLAIVMTGHGTSETVIAALRNRACDFLAKPFEVEELREAVANAFRRRDLCDIEIVSAVPDWIEILVPCDLNAVEPVRNFITELDCDLPRETRKGIGDAFHEMLSNAIEHGGKCDPSQKVQIKWVRLKKAVIYSIKDPGEGFDITQIGHAALANPADEPYRHMKLREERGLRPGGYGIILASQAIDELIYSEKRNELMLVKYIDSSAEESPQGT